MPELMASLPIAGVDGTMRRNRSGAVGSAHLKTGSLRDVTAMAGYVHANSGRRYVLVRSPTTPMPAPAALPSTRCWSGRSRTTESGRKGGADGQCAP